MAIEGVLRDVLDCDPPWDEAAAVLDWTPERVVTELDDFVLRRHRIAHDGDVDGDGRTRTIQRPYVERATRVVEAVGISTRAVIDQHVGA